MNKEVKSITYYLPSSKSKKLPPTVAVVLLTDGENVSRGVAIVNKKDIFNRKRGRAIAMGRAIKAFHNQESCTNNIINRPPAVKKTPAVFHNKCSFMPELTIFENQLIASMEQ
jgi:hypothetical protein